MSDTAFDLNEMPLSLFFFFSFSFLSERHRNAIAVLTGLNLTLGGPLTFTVMGAL